MLSFNLMFSVISLSKEYQSDSARFHYYK